MQSPLRLDTKKRARSPSLLYALSIPFLRSRFAFGALFFFVILFIFLPLVGVYTSQISILQRGNGVIFTSITLGSSKAPRSPVRIAKASLLYGRTNPIYEKALSTHAEHNKLYNYDMHVLRSRLAKGFSNKLLWLQQLIAVELQKPNEERVEWIMYFDPSAVLLNPRIPLSVFLPPSDNGLDHLQFIFTTASNDFDCNSVLFVHISDSALKTLAKAVVAPMLEPDREWGADKAISALQYVLEQDGHRDAAIYQDARWYNTEMIEDHWIARGGFFQCASREFQGKKWKGVDELLHILESDPHKFSLPLEATVYAKEPQQFWSRIAEAKRVLKVAAERGHDVSKGDLRAEVRTLKVQVELYAFDGVDLSRAIDVLKDSLELE